MNNLLTLAGSERLKAKLHSLKTRDLARARNDLILAREEGKLEENESYLHAQEQCRMIEKRIDELSDIIDSYEIFAGPIDTDHVGFGTTVTIENCDTETRRIVTLVGEPESDIDLGLISITSPLGEVLIGASVGDTVDLVAPRGTTTYEIISIES
jgi:transcription elongation factor GreA